MTGAAAAALAVPALPAAAAGPSGLAAVNHIVVIYQENHSYDNLFGQWPGTNGLSAPPAATPRSTQVGQGGTPYTCLKQDDVNLTSPPQPASCADSTTGSPFSSAFVNAPFAIDDYIGRTDTTCPPDGGAFKANGYAKGTGTPGGCTRDLVHRYYQEQYQIDGGKQDRYATGSDALGLTQGYYRTQDLPIYKYLNGAGHPNYAVGDNLFQGAFGGSFLNHQWLIAAQTPVFQHADTSGTQSGCSTGTASCDLHSVVDANGMPTTYGLYATTPSGSTVKDSQLTVARDAKGQCAPSYPGATTQPVSTVCGDYAVNTIQPFTQPYAPGTPVGKRLPMLTSGNIGDELSTAGVSWGWYSGGYDDANGNNGRDTAHPLGPGWDGGATGTSSGSCANPHPASGSTFPNCPDANFQFHHQPFGYFAHYADGTTGRRDHLQDEQQFLLNLKAPGTVGTNGATAKALPAVSFVKPAGNENEHPGYGSEPNGSDHLVSLLQAIEGSQYANDTLVVVTYDEFGGAWDHMAPPGTPANPGRPGTHDPFGPGTRVPALFVSPLLSRSQGVDHTQYDTTSVLRTIEARFNVPPLSQRDAAVNDFRLSLEPEQNPTLPEIATPGLLVLAGLGALGGTVGLRRRRRTSRA